MTHEQSVFISYSRRDNHFVSRLANDLRQAGVSVWIDAEQINPGADWKQEIVKGLSDSSVMLFLASRNSTDSQWMRVELDAFLRRQGKVIPLVVDDIGAADMPWTLAAIQYVDFRGDYNVALQQLLSALPKLLRRDQPAQSQRPQAKGYVFLNYAKEDNDFIAGLRDFLCQHGYAYWDYQDSDRDYHTDLDLELEGIIKEAAAVTSILSPNWKSSRWTRKEYLYAEEIGTPVFLLKVKDMVPTLITAGAHFIDFTSDKDAGFRKLARELKRKGL